MRSFLLLLAVVPILAACDACTSDCFTVSGEGPVIKGSGTLKTEDRVVGPFTAIQLSGVGNLLIERLGDVTVSVTADDNLVSLFTTEVRDGTLHLSLAKGKSVSGKQPLYKVTVAALREIAVAGSGSVEANRLAGDALSVSVAGSGSGRFTGQVTDLAITISGSGSGDASKLVAKRGKVVVSGSGDVTVNASDELDAKISGSGSIWYLGNPKITSQIAGSGSIKQKTN